MAGSGSAILGLGMISKGLDRTVRSIQMSRAALESTLTEPFGQKHFVMQQETDK
jgi:hypothetical protein